MQHHIYEGVCSPVRRCACAKTPACGLRGISASCAREWRTPVAHRRNRVIRQNHFGAPSVPRPCDHRFKVSTGHSISFHWILSFHSNYPEASRRYQQPFKSRRKVPARVDYWSFLDACGWLLVIPGGFWMLAGTSWWLVDGCGEFLEASEWYCCQEHNLSTETTTEFEWDLRW